MEAALAVYILNSAIRDLLYPESNTYSSPKRDLTRPDTAHSPAGDSLDKKVDTHPALFTLQQPSYPLEESMPNQPE